jgi:hypothetical protein
MFIIGDVNPRWEELAKEQGLPMVDGHQGVNKLSKAMQEFTRVMRASRKKPPSKPRPDPPQIPSPPPVPKPAEACRQRNLIPGSLLDQLHQAAHKLTGRCVLIVFAEGSTLGDSTRFADGHFQIRLSANIHGDTLLWTFLHELGHVQARTISDSGSEASANFWAERWLQKGKNLAHVHFHGKSDNPDFILRAMIEF